jgi:hypothetical protein
MKHLRGEKKELCTRNLLSDENDRVIGFLLKAGNWKILQIKTAKISKFTAYCAIWVGSISTHHTGNKIHI